jgi:hypothetical protein
MVKTGADRAEKFAMKHDAYVNMLRCKKMDKLALERFQNDLYLHVKLQEYISELDLPFGKKGEFSDLANKFLFKGTDILADLERFEIPLSYFEELLEYISTIIFLFEKCVYPQSIIKSQVTIEPLSFKQLFPETVEKLIFDDLTFELEPENKTSSFLLKTKICIHNIAETKSPILNSPTLSFGITGVSPHLNSAIVTNPNLYNQSPNIDISVERSS